MQRTPLTIFLACLALTLSARDEGITVMRLSGSFLAMWSKVPEQLLA